MYNQNIFVQFSKNCIWQILSVLQIYGETGQIRPSLGSSQWQLIS